MKVLQKLDENAGTSIEQGRFHNPIFQNREILPLRGAPPQFGPPARAKETTLSTISNKATLPPMERTRIVTKILEAVLKGNRNLGPTMGKFTIYPTDPSGTENYPEKLPK